MTKIEKKLMELVKYSLKETMCTLIFELANKPEKDCNYILPNYIIEIKDRVEKCYINLYQAIQSENRGDFESEVNSIYNTIVDGLSNINDYVVHVDQLGQSLVEENKRMEVVKMGEGLPISSSVIVGDVDKFISSFGDSIEEDMEVKYVLSKLMSILPIRLIKDKYDDFIKNGARLLLDNVSLQHRVGVTERLKGIFKSDCSEKFKEDFELMYIKLESMKENGVNIDTYNVENAEELINEITDCLENLQEVYDLLSNYFDIISYIKIIGEVAVDEEFLFGDDIVLKDIYLALSNTLKNDDDLLIDEILDKAGDEMSHNFARKEPLEDEVEAYYMNMDDEDRLKLSNATITSYSIYKRFRDIYFNSVEDDLLLTGKIMDVDDLVDDLIKYINDETMDEPLRVKKALKQRFLSNIPCTLTKEEILEYVEYALEGINDRTTTLLTYGNIYELIDENENNDDNNKDFLFN